MNPHQGNPINRRQFLCATSAGVALFHILPGGAVQGAERLAANERLNVAGIGIGSQGGSDIDAVAGEGHNVVALCDVDDKYAAKKFAQYPKARQFKDFRVMLDKMKNEIDAVVIGTPDHSHAIIAMEAMRRHKHVYCEKPLAHSVQEVRALMKAATKYRVVTQLGNQGIPLVRFAGSASGSGRAPSARYTPFMRAATPSRRCIANSATWTSSPRPMRCPQA